MSATPETNNVIPAMPVMAQGNEVVVWTRHGCVQCRPTIRQLSDKGIPHRELNVDEVPGAVEAMLAANFMQVPLVVTSETAWTGFRPDLIEQLAQRIAA
jgi:glutaredoxin-like protein NrdH